MGNTGLSASITQTTWSRLEQTKDLSKPVAVAKSGTTSCTLPSKPYNGYKPDQKPVQMRRCLAKLSSQSKQMTWPPECNSSTNTTAACFECGKMGHLHANCPHLKHDVRSVAIRAYDIGVPERNPQLRIFMHKMNRGRVKSDLRIPPTRQEWKQQVNGTWKRKKRCIIVLSHICLTQYELCQTSIQP